MAREREKEFASLTLGSRAHNVRQAITPWGNSGGFSFHPEKLLVTSTPFTGDAKGAKTPEWSPADSCQEKIMSAAIR